MKPCRTSQQVFITLKKTITVVPNKERVSESLRRDVVAAHAGLCGICDTLLDVYEVDHIIPRCCGGPNTLQNLMPLCPTCHARKTKKEKRKVRDYLQFANFISDNSAICYFCMKITRWDQAKSHVCAESQQWIKSLQDETPEYDKGRHREERPGLEQTFMATDEEKKEAMAKLVLSLDKFRYKS